jgi:chemotaxis protein methyltransferase CheR
MNSTRSKDFVEYHQYLKTHPEEEEKLRNALTINVTKFLRDPDVFNLVGREIFPSIISEKRSIKIWSADFIRESLYYAICYMICKTRVILNNVITATDIEKRLSVPVPVYMRKMLLKI